MIVRFCFYFVEFLHLSIVSGNRVYGLDTTNEREDIRTRQFAVIMLSLTLVLSTVQLFVTDLFKIIDYSGGWAVAIPMGTSALVTIYAVRDINKLGLYEDALERVRAMNSKELKKCCYRTMGICAFRVCLPVFIFFFLAWLITGK